MPNLYKTTLWLQGQFENNSVASYYLIHPEGLREPQLCVWVPKLDQGHQYDSEQKPSNSGYSGNLTWPYYVPFFTLPL